jgi:hypothetical protein
MAQVSVNVSVADDYLDHFAEVVTACKKTGLHVEQQSAAIGVISGTINTDKVADLEQVEGISHVERSREIQLPPPTSRIQ